jgi:RimJ/RimL family protein N-acetyltransferase
MKSIQTDRLAIRPFVKEDAAFIMELLNEPSFIRNIGDRDVRTLSDAERYLETGPVASCARNGFGLCLVALKESGESIGMCGLIERESLEDVDIGYAFMPRYWSQGYALETALAVKAYAREVVGLTRLAAVVDPANAASIRLLKKLGMRFEGLIKLRADDRDLEFYLCDL